MQGVVILPTESGVVSSRLVAQAREFTGHVHAVKWGHRHAPGRPADVASRRIVGLHHRIRRHHFGEERKWAREQSFARTIAAVFKFEGPLGFQCGVVLVLDVVAVFVNGALVAVAQTTLGCAIVSEVLEVDLLQRIPLTRTGAITGILITVRKVGGHTVIARIADVLALAHVLCDRNGAVRTSPWVGTTDVLAVSIAVLTCLAEATENRNSIQVHFGVAHGIAFHNDHQLALSCRCEGGVHIREFTINVQDFPLHAIFNQTHDEAATDVILRKVRDFTRDKPNLRGSDMIKFKTAGHHGHTCGIISKLTSGAVEVEILLASSGTDPHNCGLLLTEQHPPCLSRA